jgi:EAL domain-containing protein (putative c-di-GMP-specific phosphodiesterase class I)
MSDDRNRLLIVDDEPKFCAFVERVAARIGLQSKSITETSRFLEILAEYSPTVLMMDLRMPGSDGIQLLHLLRDQGCKANIILASGMDAKVLSTADRLARSHRLRVAGVLKKPIKLEALKRMLLEAAGIADALTAAELERAIERRELCVHYQAQIMRRQDHWSVEGAEALVRWQHPERGLVLPGHFLPMAEEAGLIAPLTDFVVESCIEKLADWQARKLDLRIAINLSAHTIKNLDFPDQVRALLSNHDVPGSRITFELTESVAMADPTLAMDVLLRLRVSGIGLAIDDYGTGFSTLKQLYQLPFDELKIDRTFVDDLPDGDEARAIVRATIEMAHALNMRVCAEGVETREALRYLESVNCDVAQGYYIARPARAEEIESLVGPWHRDALRRIAK